jgi:hypothetical protein
VHIVQIAGERLSEEGQAQSGIDQGSEELVQLGGKVKIQSALTSAPLDPQALTHRRNQLEKSS